VTDYSIWVSGWVLQIPGNTWKFRWVGRSGFWLCCHNYHRTLAHSNHTSTSSTQESQWHTGITAEH